jgi:hypothetical protein
MHPVPRNGRNTKSAPLEHYPYTGRSLTFPTLDAPYGALRVGVRSGRTAEGGEGWGQGRRSANITEPVNENMRVPCTLLLGFLL